MYAQLKKGGEFEDELLADTMLFIDDKLMGKAYSAGESGNADTKALSKRLSASGMAGHEVISTSEDKMIEKVEGKSPFELERQLASIMSGVAKSLPSPK